MVAQPSLMTTETAEEFQRRLYEELERGPQAIDGVCVHCGGMGMLSLDFPVGHPFFGKGWKCICVHRKSEAYKAEEAQATRLHRCNIAEIYRTYSLDTFRAMYDLEGKAEAFRMCSEMARGLPPTMQVGDAWYSKHGLYLYGEFGTGKTGLAMSVLNAGLAMGLSVYAMDYRIFLGDVQDSYSNQGLPDPKTKKKAVTRQQMIDYAASVDLLFIDDIGDKDRIKPISDDQRDITYMLIQQRYLNLKPMLIASNLFPDEFIDQFGGRIAQRVFERCHICEVAGLCLRR